MTALSDEAIRIWINDCRSTMAQDTLKELLAYRVRGFAAPLKQGALEAVVIKMLDWAGKRCPCKNDQPNPCPLCLADANKSGDACKAVDETFPPHFLQSMRNALALKAPAVENVAPFVVAAQEAVEALSYAMRGTSDAEQSDKFAATIAKLTDAIATVGA